MSEEHTKTQHLIVFECASKERVIDLWSDAENIRGVVNASGFEGMRRWCDVGFVRLPWEAEIDRLKVQVDELVAACEATLNWFGETGFHSHGPCKLLCDVLAKAKGEGDADC
jgi:hypothetical protein